MSENGSGLVGVVLARDLHADVAVMSRARQHHEASFETALQPRHLFDVDDDVAAFEPRDERRKRRRLCEAEGQQPAHRALLGTDVSRGRVERSGQRKRFAGDGRCERERQDKQHETSSQEVDLSCILEALDGGTR